MQPNPIDSAPMRQILLDHIRRYPLAEPQDFLKLVHQSAFGGAHLAQAPVGQASGHSPCSDAEIEGDTTAARFDAHLAQSPVGQASGHSPCSDAEIEGDTTAASFGAAWSRLKDELMHLPPAPDVDSPALEPVGGGLMRLNLRALSALGLRAETVCGLFLQTCPPRDGAEEALAASLAQLGELLPGARPEIDAYRAAGCPAVHHSERYRHAYRPAYRLVPEAANAFLSLFQRIDALLAEKPFVRVAIDGNCAAGKSTLGALLREVYGANLFHMDDYFLPFACKTPERLAEPGGNVDYERFREEVAGREPGSAIRWRPFDCAAQALGAWQTAGPKPLTVVEGSYSLHPTLRSAYDLKVFLAIDPERQSARILARNGAEKHRRFIEEWIPLENAYFSALDIRSLCDLAFDV